MTRIFSGIQEIDYPVIDSDAHVNEPPDLWVANAPARLRDRVPKVVRGDNGDSWSYNDGASVEPVALYAAAGRSWLDYAQEGATFDDIRRGTWEPKARVKDMEIDGIYAAVVYPSVTIKGAKTYGDDPELQKFCVRTYNEWILDFGVQAGGRIIPQAVIPTTGVDDALDELVWAIDSGHRGVVISRMPNGDFESQPDDDRFWAVAQEASMPVGIHIGSFVRPNPNRIWTGGTDVTKPAFLALAAEKVAGTETIPVCTEFLFSGLFEKFPRLKVLLVEAGIGWIAGVLEQCDDIFLRYRWFTGAVERMQRMPSETFHRNFYSTFMKDKVGLDLRHYLNIDHIMWSTDYPHSVTDWPNSRLNIERFFRGLPADEVKKMLHTNAKRLYRLDHIPDTVAELDL